MQKIHHSKRSSLCWTLIKIIPKTLPRYLSFITKKVSSSELMDPLEITLSMELGYASLIIRLILKSSSTPHIQIPILVSPKYLKSFLGNGISILYLGSYEITYTIILNANCIKRAII